MTQDNYSIEAARCFKMTLRIRQLFHGQQLFQPAAVLIKEPTMPTCTSLVLQWDGVRNIFAHYTVNGATDSISLTANGKPKDEHMLFMVDLLKSLDELHDTATKARDFATDHMKEASNEAEAFLLEKAPPEGD